MMAKTRAEKEQSVSELKEKFERMQSVGLVVFQNLFTTETRFSYLNVDDREFLGFYLYFPAREFFESF